MKKILLTGGVALLSFGLYSDLMGAKTQYTHESYASVDGVFQDTTPKKKKDTTGKTPKDKKRKDSSFIVMK